MVMYCRIGAYFAWLWGHDNPEGPIFTNSRAIFVVTFSNCPLFMVSKLQTHIYICTLNYVYVELSHSVRGLLPLKIHIK